MLFWAFLAGYSLTTVANNRAMRWIGNVARMHPGRLLQQVPCGWTLDSVRKAYTGHTDRAIQSTRSGSAAAAPATVLRGGQTKHQGHRISRILRDRAAIADPKIRHRFYKNGTDVSKITSDVDPVDWQRHVAVLSRRTCK